MAKKISGFEIGQEVIGTFQGKEYPGVIEDITGNEHSVRTSLWQVKKWWKSNELTPAHKENKTMAVNTKSTKKVVDNTLVKQEKNTLVPVNLAKIEEEATVVAVPTQEKPMSEAKLQSSEKKLRESQFSPDFSLLPATDVSEEGIIQVALSSLINLDATPIKNARYAMREINQAHKAALKIAYERGDDMPAITVVPSTMGYIVVDGNHRWAAMESIVSEAVGIFKKEDITPEKQAMLVEKRQSSVLYVSPLNGMTERAILQYAFEANLRNGLPSSENSRSRYAIWLLEDAREHGDKLSLRQAAMIAGVSHVAVIKMRDREANKANKMVDTWGDTEQETAQVLTEEKEKKEVDTLQVNTRKLFAAIKAICKEVDDEKLLVGYFLDFIDTNTVVDAAIVARVLAVVAATEEEENDVDEDEDSEEE